MIETDLDRGSTPRISTILLLLPGPERGSPGLGVTGFDSLIVGYTEISIGP